MTGECCAQWSTYRGDVYRSAYTPNIIPDDIKFRWSFRVSAPSIAWSPPAKRSLWQELDSIAPRVTDDHVFHPIADEDSVYFASSSDDQVRCLDLHSGLVRWNYCHLTPAEPNENLFRSGRFGRLADPEPLKAMLDACERVAVP